eukprot:6492610-Amphidinium_carterae.1
MLSQGERADASKPRQRRKKTETNEGWTSWQLAKALDHTLHLYGLKGFSSFVENEHRSGVLQSAETRYWVADASHVASASSSSSPVPELPVVVNDVTGEKRWELKPWVERPTALILTGDECAVNLRVVNWLIGKMGARVVWVKDPAHRSWNDARAGLRDAGCWVDVLESLQVLSTLQGPWRTAAWWQEMRQSAETHMSRTGCQDEWFRALFDELSNEYGHELQEQSEVSLDEVWKRLKDDRVLESRGQKVGMCRWFQWCAAWRTFSNRYYTMYYHVLILGHMQGVFPTVSKSPLAGSSLTKQLTAPTATSKTHGKTLAERQALEELQVQRAKTKNAIELAAHLLSQDSLRRRCAMALCLLQPLYTAHTKEIKNMKDPKRNFMMQLSFAKHQYNYVLLRLWQSLHDAQKLVREMHFSMSVTRDKSYKEELFMTAQPAVSISSSSSSAAEPVVCKPLSFMPEDEEDFDYAGLAFRLLQKLVKHRCLSMKAWTEPPLSFVLLLDADVETRRQALERLAEEWKCIEWVETVAGGYMPMARVVNNIPWLHNTLVREMYLMLRQHHFGSVSSDLLHVLNQLFRGMNNSVVVEDTFKVIKDSGRQSNTHACSRQHRFFQGINDQVLGKYGMRELPDDHLPLDQNVARVLPKSFFESAAHKPSIKKEDVDGLLGSAGSWPSPSASVQKILSAPWSMLQSCYRSQNLEVLDHCWKSLLMGEGHIIKVNASGTYGLSLRATEWGYLSWPMKRITHRNRVFFTPVLHDNTKPDWCHVINLNLYSCIPVQCLPPSVTSIFQAELAEQLGGGIWVMQSREEESMWLTASRSGFKGCGKVHLSKILAELDILKDVPKENQPRTVQQQVETIILALIPDITKEEMVQSLMTRAGAERYRGSILLNANNLEVSATTLAPDDLKEAKDTRETASASASSRVQTLSFLRDRDYLSGENYDLWMRAMGVNPMHKPKTAVPKKSAKAVIAKTEWTWMESELKKKLPKAQGATLTEVHNHHTHTWTGRYSRAPAGWQKTFSRTVSAARPTAVAAQLVFEWLWRVHTESTGEVCPHTYASVLV